MKMSSVFKKVSVVTAFTLAAGTSLPAFAHAAQVEKSTQEIVVVSEYDFHLPTTVYKVAEITEEGIFEEMPSIHEMSEEQRKIFDELVEEEVKKHGGDHPELYREALTDFFDSRSDTFNNLDLATKALYDGVSESLNDSITGKGDLQPESLRIGVKFAGSALNLAIGAAVGGGVGAIQAYIQKVGKDAAKRLFTRTVVSRLQAWGANKLAGAVGFAVAFALEYMDIGARIAEYLDSIDSKPNNGWIDF